MSTRPSCWGGSCGLLVVVEGVAEEVEAIAVAAGDGLGHGAERRVDTASVGEAFRQHLHLHELSFVGTGQDSARQWQAVINRRCNGDRLGRGRGGGWVAWGIESEVGVAGQLGGASSGALGQVALSQGLQPPDDAFDQPGAVASPSGFPEEFGEALPQLADGQALQRCDLVDDAQIHKGSPFWVFGNGQPVWTVSLVSPRNSRPSEIKRRDFWTLLAHPHQVTT